MALIGEWRPWGWSWNEGNYPNIAIYKRPYGFRIAFRVGARGYAFGYYGGFFREKRKVRLV